MKRNSSRTTHPTITPPALSFCRRPHVRQSASGKRGGAETQSHYVSGGLPELLCLAGFILAGGHGADSTAAAAGDARRRRRCAETSLPAFPVHLSLEGRLAGGAHDSPRRGVRISLHFSRFSGGAEPLHISLSPPLAIVFHPHDLLNDRHTIASRGSWTDLNRNRQIHRQLHLVVLLSHCIASWTTTTLDIPHLSRASPFVAL